MLSSSVLAGIELGLNEPPILMAEGKDFHETAVIHLTSIIVLTSDIPASKQAHIISIRAHVDDETSVTILSFPSNSLQLTWPVNYIFHVDSEPRFDVVSTWKSADSHKVRIGLSGFIQQFDEDEPLDDEDMLQAEGVKWENPVNNGSKKRRAERQKDGDQDDDDEQEDEEEEEEDEADGGDDDDLDEENDNEADEEDDEEAPSASEETPSRPSKQQKLSSEDKRSTQPTLKPSASKQSNHATVKSKGQSSPNVSSSPSSASVSKGAAAAAPIKYSNGLIVQDVAIGLGKEAKKGSQVSVRYQGELMNGKIFDTNFPKGRPIEFRIGAGEMIQGFDQGIKGMKVGGRRILTVPPELGYGKKGNEGIPPNSQLTFTVQLLKA